MKNCYLPLAGLALLAAACSSDTPPEPRPDTREVTLNVGIADVIFVRGGSQEGGLANMDGKNLTFTAVVTTADEDPVAVYAEAKTVTVAAGSAPGVSFTAQLVPGVDYKIVAYANFEGANALNLAADAKPQDYLTAINAISCTYSLNNEAQDSYAGTMSFTADGNSENLNLTRPCAKIRVVNTGTALPAAATVSGTLSNAFALSNTFNASTQAFAQTELTSSALAAAALPTGYTEADGQQTVAVLYVPIDKPVDDATESTVNLTLVFANGTTTSTKDLGPIPVKRNCLTTVTGNFSL